MADRLDVVAVRVKDEGPVIVGRVLGSHAGPPVLSPAGGQRGLVERIDLFPPVRREGDVNGRPGRVGRRDGEIGCLFESELDLSSPIDRGGRSLKPSGTRARL